MWIGVLMAFLRVDFIFLNAILFGKRFDNGVCEQLGSSKPAQGG